LAPYLAVLVGVRPSGYGRDARASPESPALWPGALFDPLLSLFFPINFPFLLFSRERAFVPVPPTFSQICTIV